MASNKPTIGASLRKISEDSRLRPFLSSLFDPESYVTTVIADGRSEECFESIISYIEDINAEIKSYISLHKDNLMSGMQDVAALAEKYNNLSVSSQKLHVAVTRMKKEAMDQHQLIATRTLELERIHETTAILHQLKHFASAKTQLDSYLKDTDARNLSSAAKTLSELERLLTNPKLMEIKFVRDASPAIKQFGKSVRVLAQERLLAAIADKNQALIASSLQVFYNLDSLAEVVLMVVDVTVKKTIEGSGDALDFEQLSAAPAELLNGGSTVTAAAPPSASKKTASSAHASPVPQMSLSQLRIAIRELAHHWSALIHTKATEVHVFQRVVVKKEDPSTHEKFIDVLKRAQVPAGAGADGLSNLSYQYLAAGQLLDLFWYRLSAALQAVANDKVRGFPVAASRAYPYLRKAATEVVDNLNLWTEKDSQRDLGSSMSGMFSTGSQFADLESAGRRGAHSGLFGSLMWTQDDLLGCVGRGVMSGRSSSAFTHHSDFTNARLGRSKEAGDPERDCRLVGGLKPLRDRYLLSALHRMTAPILQMFPELEGYTAAVPSKRDLQTLIRAIQTEFVLVVVESDAGLLQAVCREFVKVVKVMLSKIEGMISNTAETRKISSQNNFARTHPQEHNGLLLSLLMQFKELLEKIPVFVGRQAGQELSASSILTSSGEAEAIHAIDEASTREMTAAVQQAVELVEDLAQRQILDSIVALLSGYNRSVLLGMHKEGAVHSHSAPKSGAASPADETLLDCSLAVQTVVRQMPVMFKSHIQSLVRCKVVDAAIEEICLRTMHAYVSIAALTRPVNEATRLRTAKDMTALEMLLSGLCTIHNQDKCPVVQEFKAFRRLLFEADVSAKTDKPKSSSAPAEGPNKPPSRAQLFALDYVPRLRPSTLLGYCISCAPAQLLSPYDVSPEASLLAYVEDLALVVDPSSQEQAHHTSHRQTQKEYALQEAALIFKDFKYSVRSLYSLDNEWKLIDNEKKSWATVQVCLESFFKRISVAEGAQKQNMRAWYEAVLDIGSHCHGGRR